MSGLMPCVFLDYSTSKVNIVKLMTIFVTGAAGFIGSAFAREALKKKFKIIIYDALTYAGHLENINEILDGDHCSFFQGNIIDEETVLALLKKYQVSALVNFAAESHVDNSITGSKAFIETNILGTYSLLEAARKYWNCLDGEEKNNFRYVQVSTDEVYGTLGDEGKFDEERAYQPNSPYSASKASGDHLARAWFHTYGLPTLTTNCSNNYGPRQFPEKLIPLMIRHVLEGKALPVYGTGKNVRDWIHVEDHSRGVLLALEKGIPGETYCFGGNSERTNLQVVETLCDLMDKIRPQSRSSRELISFVKDRAGHDWRYAINDYKAQNDLGFAREFKNFEQGLESTIRWYLANDSWIQSVTAKNKG